MPVKNLAAYLEAEAPQTGPRSIGGLGGHVPQLCMELYDFNPT